jgi:hypothetical protein
VRAYRGTATVDAFITPGTPPYYQPPARSGIGRYEEDDAAVRYSGSPYLQMPQTWNAVNDNNSSDGYYAQSATTNQTVSLVFSGTWAGFGYVASTTTGQVDVSIDGVSRGTVDTYVASARPQSAYYSNLASGIHTITLRILSTRNPLSTGYNFNFDYFDVWDGTPLPRGQAEMPFATTWNWTEGVSTVASTGRYFRDGTAMWSAFTSDRVIYQALATSWAGQVEVSIDGTHAVQCSRHARGRQPGQSHDGDPHVYVHEPG